jgi:hypothetical protein
MKHLMNFAKAAVAASIVLEVGSRVAPKLPAAIAVKGYDLRPHVAGGVALFGVITAATMLGGKKLGNKVVPAV